MITSIQPAHKELPHHPVPSDAVVHPYESVELIFSRAGHITRNDPPAWEGRSLSHSLFLLQPAHNHRQHDHHSGHGGGQQVIFTVFQHAQAGTPLAAVTTVGLDAQVPAGLTGLTGLDATIVGGAAPAVQLP